MLTVDVKFVAYELVPGLLNAQYSVEAGTTVHSLLALCEANCGASIPEKNYRYMYPLINGRPATLDSAITDNSTLHLCRVITGG